MHAVAVHTAWRLMGVPGWKIAISKAAKSNNIAAVIESSWQNYLKLGTRDCVLDFLWTTIFMIINFNLMYILTIDFAVQQFKLFKIKTLFSKWIIPQIIS